MKLLVNLSGNWQAQQHLEFALDKLKPWLTATSGFRVTADRLGSSFKYTNVVATLEAESVQWFEALASELEDACGRCRTKEKTNKQVPLDIDLLAVYCAKTKQWQFVERRLPLPEEVALGAAELGVSS